MPRVLFRVLLSAVSLCLLLVSFESSAFAASIGMCASTAQSVEAPPPMFPAEGTTVNRPDMLGAHDCKLEDKGLFGVQEPNEPGQRVTPSAEMPDHKVILGALVPVIPAPSTRTAVRKDSLSLPDEHRWRGLRPPRA